MEELYEAIKTSIMKFTVLDIVDILMVTIIIYGLLRVTSRTRAIQVLKGLGVIILLAQICQMIKLPTISWLLNSVVDAGVVFLVIVFQPEIRRALEKIGRGKIFDMASFTGASDDVEKMIGEVQRAVLNMSIHKTGALIVFEKETGLKEVIESGTTLDAEISSQLVENVFFPNSPMHDGAMIVADRKIVAAGCFLPLSDNKQIGRELGTRHRAALGISEISDATVIIVSEETGVISTCHEGVMTRYIDRAALKKVLEGIFIGNEGALRSIGGKLRRRGAKK